VTSYLVTPEVPPVSRRETNHHEFSDFSAHQRLAHLSPLALPSIFYGGADEGIAVEKGDEDTSRKKKPGRKKAESKGQEMNKATLGALLVIVSLAAVPARAGNPAAAAADVSGVINVNSATAEQIAFLPRVGIKLAERVVEYRKSNGPFKKIEDLMEVKGVGEKLFVALKPHLTVSGTTTLTQKIKSTGMRSRGKTTRAAKAA